MGSSAINQIGKTVFTMDFLTVANTLYTSMLNFVEIAKKLDQEALPIFCDKGVFRVLVNIYLQRKDGFQILIQMLGGFHAAKCAEHSIEKYFQGSGIEGSLW